jgi:hypothetical protein
VDGIEFPLEPGCHPGRSPQQGICPGHRGDGYHNALTGLPDAGRLVPPQVFQQFVIGLVGQEPQRAAIVAFFVAGALLVRVLDHMITHSDSDADSDDEESGDLDQGPGLKVGRAA